MLNVLSDDNNSNTSVDSVIDSNINNKNSDVDQYKGINCI